MSETAVNTVGELAWVSSDSRKQINAIRKLWQDHPDEVRMLALPENNDGCIYAAIPKDWIKFSPPRQRDLSDEERQALSERMRKLRANQHGQENIS